MLSLLIPLLNMLKTHGARLTVKRKRVLSTLIESEKALSAYDVINLCQQKFNENIPTIPQFLICGKCDQVKDISIKKSTIAELKHNVEDAGFQLASPQLEMNCICNNCTEEVPLHQVD